MGRIRQASFGNYVGHSSIHCCRRWKAAIVAYNSVYTLKQELQVARTKTERKSNTLPAMVIRYVVMTEFRLLHVKRLISAGVIVARTTESHRPSAVVYRCFLVTYSIKIILTNSPVRC